MVVCLMAGEQSEAQKQKNRAQGRGIETTAQCVIALARVGRLEGYVVECSLSSSWCVDHSGCAESQGQFRVSPFLCGQSWNSEPWRLAKPGR